MTSQENCFRSPKIAKLLSYPLARRNEAPTDYLQIEIAEYTSPGLNLPAFQSGTKADGSPNIIPGNELTEKTKITAIVQKIIIEDDINIVGVPTPHANQDNPEPRPIKKSQCCKYLVTPSKFPNSDFYKRL